MEPGEERPASSSQGSNDEDIDKMVAAKQNKSVGEINDDVRKLDLEMQAKHQEMRSMTKRMNELQLNTRLNTMIIDAYKERPLLVSTVSQILDEKPEDLQIAEIDDNSVQTPDNDKCIVLKTSSRLNLFSSNTGLVNHKDLKPGDLVGIRPDTFSIMEKLPVAYDHRVKTMELDERPTETFADIGGLDQQIQELQEAIIFPMTKKDKFERLNIQPCKGVLLYGPPGTGKTLIARACAAQTNATFLKLAATQLTQAMIGDGAKLVREAFALAKDKAPTIIFIDELDAIGSKRFDSEQNGDREVQRTMLELLNQLDGFSPSEGVKVIAATNRIDVLDPALMRSGRLDKKIEFPEPTEEARANIMQIHSRSMNCGDDVKFIELGRDTENLNGAQCKAVCVEAGMIALRRGATIVIHEDFIEAIGEVKAKKKQLFNYYA